jgi:hypothetical protein
MTRFAKNSSLIVGTGFILLFIGSLFIGSEPAGDQASSDPTSELWADYQFICDSAGQKAEVASDGNGHSRGPTSVLRGIAVMGDSDSDEYRAEDNRGGEYSSTTFNWVELLALRRGLNFGCWGARVEPRRTGFAFNWARSGATAASLLRDGQHIGVASQVSAGKVTLVFLRIGSNDFLRRRYEEIYNDELSDSALEGKVADFIDDTATAVDAVLDAGLVVVVVTEVLDPNLSPIISRKYPNTADRQRVTDVVEAVNSGLSLMADKRGLVLVKKETPQLCWGGIRSLTDTVIS